MKDVVIYRFKVSSEETDVNYVTVKSNFKKNVTDFDDILSVVKELLDKDNIFTEVNLTIEKIVAD